MINRKSLLLPVVVSVSFSTLFSHQVQSAAANESPAEEVTLKCSSLTATGNSEYPPYLWRESAENNVLLGANRIIMDEIGRRIGVPIELRHTGSWARAQHEVKTGRIDLMAGAFFTIPRIQWMDYVYPAFLDTTSTVWKKQGTELAYQKREDLKPLKGVTVINNSFGQEFDAYAEQELTISKVASLELAFKILSHGRTDYVLYEKNPGLAYAGMLGMADSIEAVEPPISSEGLYLTVSHQSSCNDGALRGLLTKTVRDMTADGFMQKALQQGLKDWQDFQGK